MKLKLSLAQIDVITGDPKGNLKKAKKYVEEASKKGSELIVFPELWTTGFNWKKNKKLANTFDHTIQAISDLADDYQIWISGSVLSLNEDQKPTNTSILFDPEGNQSALYRKTHLFSFAEEDKHLTPGKELTIVEAPWGKTGLAICYDIRFPEVFRSYALKGADIALIPLAFPHPRKDHLKTLLKARAIENQMFIIAVNQVGTKDFGRGEDVTFCGNSTIIDPWGNVIIETNDQQEILVTETIDLSRTEEVRSQMKVLEDRRPDIYDI